MVKRSHPSSNPVVTMVSLKMPQLNDDYNAEAMVNVQGFMVFVCKLHIFQYNCSFFLSLTHWISCSPTGQTNTRAFLSHGGLNSIYEAMYHGVPVVGVPLFGDHYDTMTRVQAKGMGIMLEWKRMSEEDLYTAMVNVITDKR